MMKVNIAIDGPSGAGKSTIAKAAAIDENNANKIPSTKGMLI